MAELPWAFCCSFIGPNQEKYEIGYRCDDTAMKVKERFSELSGYPKDNLKVFFERHAMDDNEYLQELVPLGFTTGSELNVKLVDCFQITVETEDGKEFVVDVNKNMRLMTVANVVCPRMNIPMGLGEIWIGDKEIDQFRTIAEMDVVEGNVLSFRLDPLADLILKKDSLTRWIIKKMIRYINTVPFWKLKRIITKELLIEVKKVMEKKKENIKIVNSLFSLLSSIAFRGAAQVNLEEMNEFSYVFDCSGLLSEMEEESKRILRMREREGEGMKKEDEERMMGYCLLMKWHFSDVRLLKDLSEYLMKGMEEGGEGEKDWMNEIKRSLCLGGICEDYCLFNLFFSFFYFMNLFYAICFR
jgi:hypothetical protein